MRQIIKVESFVKIYFKDWGESCKLFENRTDLTVEEINYDMCKKYSWSKGDCVKFKQISYQTWDDENGKWVVLPNPKQPKIEGISINDEGVNNNE